MIVLDVEYDPEVTNPSLVKQVLAPQLRRGLLVFVSGARLTFREIRCDEVDDTPVPERKGQ